jgi:hypothetical protein
MLVIDYTLHLHITGLRPVYTKNTFCVVEHEIFCHTTLILCRTTEFVK